MSARRQHPHRFAVTPDEAGKRLDKFLTERLPDMSRAAVQALLRAGHVTDTRSTTIKDGAHRVKPGEDYTITVAESAKDIFGQPLHGSRTFNFRAGDAKPRLALQSGTVDCTYHIYTLVWALKLFEVAPYITQIEDSSAFTFIAVNKSTVNDVRTQFGPPNRVVRYPGRDGDSWEYNLRGGPGNDLFVGNNFVGSVSKFDATTGAGGPFFGGVSNPLKLALFGNNLFVSDNGRVAEYDATTGALINPTFITGLSGANGLAILGNNLFVASNGSGTVGEYDAITANFITGLSSPAGLALQVQAVPEPSTWALPALCFAALLFRRFSRRSA